MLYHHGAQDYNVAASEAAKSQRTKFEAEIESGKARAQKVIEQIFTQIPQDRVVQNNKLEFTAVDSTVKIKFPALQLGDGKLIEAEEGFHRHAIGQAAARAQTLQGMPDANFKPRAHRSSRCTRTFSASDKALSR